MAPFSATQPELVRLVNIRKAFGPVKALSDVSLSLRSGEIHALLGENGAGKSTLMNVLYGLLGIDQGEIVIGGTDVSSGWSTRRAIEASIGMVHQHFSLVDEYTALENVVMPTLRWREGRIDWRRHRERLDSLYESYGMKVPADALVQDLSVGEKQQVEILKMLFQGARILILDEPTSVLTPQQAERMLHTLTRFRDDGYCVVIITHKLSDAMQFADRITVLRHGCKMGEVLPAQTSVDEVARLMIDLDLGASRMQRGQPKPDMILEARDLTVSGNGRAAVDGVSLALRAGEILGIAGVAGNGQSELAEAIIGLRPLASGRITLEGEDVTSKPIATRRAGGMSFVPEDRHAMAMVDGMDVASNLVLERVGGSRFARLGIIDRTAIRENAVRHIREFDIRVHSPSALMGTLSGGNQQKVVMARELSSGPRAIVVCEPSRGLDFSASAYVRERIVESAGAGVGVLLVSSDLDELLQLSHRIAVMYRGQIIGIVEADDFDVETIGLMMAGIAPEPAGTDVAAS